MVVMLTHAIVVAIHSNLSVAVHAFVAIVHAVVTDSIVMAAMIRQSRWFCI